MTLRRRRILYAFQSAVRPGLGWEIRDIAAELVQTPGSQYFDMIDADFNNDEIMPRNC